MPAAGVVRSADQPAGPAAGTRVPGEDLTGQHRGREAADHSGRVLIASIAAGARLQRLVTSSLAGRDGDRLGVNTEKEE